MHTSVSPDLTGTPAADIVLTDSGAADQTPSVDAADRAAAPSGDDTAVECGSTLAAVVAAADNGYPVVGLADGAEGVVVASRDTLVEVLLDGGIVRHFPPATPVRAVTDPALTGALLRQAMAYLDREHREAVRRRDDLHRAHQRQLTQIRVYAIQRHLAGDICRGGLNDFLREFELGEYEPLVRVRYTITGSYLVRAGSEHDAATDARGYLGVDLDNVDDVVEDSDAHEVVVDSVDQVNDDE
ncbi:hypothetical protein [Krasilnikovia sp. M28-CT-15]|uniref:hypothetical protein n=1 Tax=Krasilnikovia sp. M28-CT-15 TaxID=3373540 RepID=UPI00387773BB